MPLPAGGQQAPGQGPDPGPGGAGPRVEAVGVGVRHAPEVDGRLDEAAWATAPVASDFVQFAPSPGTAPSQRTEVRLVHTAEALYVAARMRDIGADAVTARRSRRDEPVVADRFSVSIDSYDDRRTAFQFEVSAAGVQSDRLLYGDTRTDGNWDAVWASAVTVDSVGWTAELRIPFSQLRFELTESEGETWGVNFEREIARLGEVSQWAPLPADGSRVVSAFGTMTGLEGLRSPANLEVRPYAVLRADHSPVAADNPFRGPTELGVSLGGDVSYGLGPNMTLNTTINPDFGQVEADPSVVNLSAFETFFPEKRPFFLEGADIFRFDLGTGPGDGQLFYSRRIGRRPHGRPPSGADHVRDPGATTILGAAKLSGKTADGWSVGVLNALTAEERAEYQTSGEAGSVVTEPLTDYGVVRVTKDYGRGEHSVGGIFTSTVRAVGSAGLGSDLPGEAYAGGLDGRWRFGGYELQGYVLGSHVGGAAEAIARRQRDPVHYYHRPDADHLTFDSTRTSLSGASARIRLEKVGGGHWQGAVTAQTRTPGFDANDLGFQERSDQLLSSGFLWYQSLGPQGPFRSWNAYANGWGGWTYGGERTYARATLGGSFELENYWTGSAAMTYLGTTLSPTELRGGPALREQPAISGSLGMGTDRRRPARVELRGRWRGEIGSAGREFGVAPTLTVKPSDAARLSVGPAISWNRDAAGYVGTVQRETAPRYLVGRLRQRTVSATARLDYAFSPRLSLQVYAQPFVSVGEYDRLAEVARPRARSFDRRFQALAGVAAITDGTVAVDHDGDGTPEYTFGVPDFHVRQIRSNVVLRWEYRPGSRVFVAWSQDRSDPGPGNLDPYRDLGAILTAPGRNVLVIKVQHWLGL